MIEFTSFFGIGMGITMLLDIMATTFDITLTKKVSSPKEKYKQTNDYNKINQARCLRPFYI